ncbi:MAG: sodium/solute symporter [Kiritimatiellae bacterium]|nr:sodium/solute symporter [Kiritimatiellia bacterium]
MRAIDLFILAAYLAGVTVFGCSFYFRKNAKGTAGFVAGGGRVPSWAISLSIFATYVSSISFLALPAKAFASNWNALVLSFTVPLAAIVAAVAFVPLYRNLNSVSAYAFLEKRFGPWARMYGSVCFLVMQTARSGVILYLLAILLKMLFGWSVPAIILVVGLATCVYSMLGGVLAVIWTDAIQSIVLIAGTLLCIGVLVFTMPDGLAASASRIWADGKISLGSFSLSDWSGETFWVTFFYAIFINLQNLGIDQSFTQRYISAKDGRAAAKSVCFGCFLYLPVTFCFVAIGTLLWAYYTGRPGSLPDEVAAVTDSVFPYFIVHSLPPGVTGLLVAAIAAAAMSTISTTLNSGATVIMEDWFRRYVRRDASEKACVTVLRASTVVLGIASVAIAFAVIGVESALSTWWMLQSVLSGGMLGLFLLGWASRRVSPAQAGVATLLGMATVAWVVFFQKSFHPNLSIVFGTSVLLLSGFVLSRLSKVRDCA